MSILLEALRQKSRNDVDIKRDNTQALTLNSEHPNSHADEVVALNDKPLSLDALLEPLQIQPPEHLSWQLSASDTRQLSLSDMENQQTSGQVDSSAALELLLPIGGENVKVAEASSKELLDHLKSSWSLATPVLTDNSIPDHRLNEIQETLDASIQPSIKSEQLNDENQTLVERAGDELITRLDVLDDINVQQSNAMLSSADFELDIEQASLKQNPLGKVTVEKPDSVVEVLPLNTDKVNTSASATSYLNLLNKNHDITNKPIFSKKIKLQQPSLSPKLLIASVVGATVVGIAYYGFSLWEEERALLAEQMARYEAPIVMQSVTNDAQSLNSEQVASAGSVDSKLPVPVVETSEQTPTAVTNRVVQSAVAESKKRRQTSDYQYTSKPAVAVVVKALSISDLLNHAWNSWRQGDIVSAEKDYRQVLERQPNNRDALMGMFAITQLQPKTNEQSQEIAERLIELYPQDEEVKVLVANAFYLGSASVVNNESNLKSQLQNAPRNAALYYQLGIVYASSKRWAEAQSVFFKAASLDAGQSEYLANLAISYDQLGKVALAIESYQKALEAAKVRPSSLNKDALEARLQFLSSQTFLSE